MLLLVLILVLIAFGLLLVGFLSASVLWAWVSVAVSVGAAGVLLFDTLQRRSVVRAGDDAGGEPPIDAAAERTVSVAAPSRPAFETAGGGLGDVDPVTEVIPVIRPAAAHAPVVDPRFDPDADAQQTVMLPAVQPSGSPAGPSGATPGQALSSESSSPSVTISGEGSRVPESPAVGEQSTVFVRAAGPGAPAEPSPDLPPATSDPVPADGPTVHSTPVDPGTGDRADAVSGAAVGTTASAAAARIAPGSSDTVSTPADPMFADPGAPSGVGDIEATAVVTTPAQGDRAPTAPPAEEPGSLFASRPGGHIGSQAGARDPAAAAQPPNVTASEPAASEPAASEPAASDPAASERGSEPPAPVVGSESPPAEMPPAAGAPEAPNLDGEAPEEQPDPQAAAVVAALEDEVLVIDEQPRYHVTGCRALAAVALIPLPVREAVELGFTPCGWCSPDHTLASRHRATAR